MSGFPSLEPAFTVRLNPAEGFQVGDISSGGSLNVVPVASGSLISEPGFPVPVDAELVFGSDYVRVEQAQSHARINVNAVLKNKADGSFLSYSYKGIVDVNPEFVAIFSGQPDAQTTDYGTAFTHVNFETGSNALKPLEHGLFVGSAHFVVTGEGSNKTFFVESKVSRVVK